MELVRTNLEPPGFKRSWNMGLGNPIRIEPNIEKIPTAIDEEGEDSVLTERKRAKTSARVGEAVEVLVVVWTTLSIHNRRNIYRERLRTGGFINEKKK